MNTLHPLTAQEQEWILAKRITRITDNQEVLIYPMGAERYIQSQLQYPAHDRYPIYKDIVEKDVLIIPGYGNNAFIFAEAGAKSVSVYDKDPVTIAWLKAFKLYFHYKIDAHSPSVGELLTALTKWYPPSLHIPTGRIKRTILWLIQPKALRRQYLLLIIKTVQQAIQENIDTTYELNQAIQFFVGELKNVTGIYDTVYVPYLLGVKNGIEKERDIVKFIKDICKTMHRGNILITPTRNTKEFHLTGNSYFSTTSYDSLSELPELKDLIKEEDPQWFKTQGMLVIKRM